MRNALSVELLRIRRECSSTTLPLPRHLHLQIDSLDSILLQPSQAQFQQSTSRSHRILHLFSYSFRNSRNDLARRRSVGRDVRGGVLDGPREGRGREGRAELDVAEMRGEGVESVKDVRRVEDRGVPRFALFNEESEQSRSYQDVQIDRYLSYRVSCVTLRCSSLADTVVDCAEETTD